MPRRPAKVTQAEIARALRAAKQEGMAVRVLADGTIEIYTPTAEKEVIPTSRETVAAKRNWVL